MQYFMNVQDCHDPKKGEHSAQGSSEDKIHHKSDLEKDGHEKKDKGVCKLSETKNMVVACCYVNWGITNFV